jgi:C4-dicarboxylate-binding protein DctP
MDKTFWNRLSPELQTVIRTAMHEVTQWQRQQAVLIERDKLREIQRCNCIEINELSEEELMEWKQFYQPLYQIMERRLGNEFLHELNLSQQSGNAS